MCIKWMTNKNLLHKKNKEIKVNSKKEKDKYYICDLHEESKKIKQMNKHNKTNRLREWTGGCQGRGGCMEGQNG